MERGFHHWQENTEEDLSNDNSKPKLKNVGERLTEAD
jgi:hypothetical protein